MDKFLVDGQRLTNEGINEVKANVDILNLRGVLFVTTCPTAINSGWWTKDLYWFQHVLQSMQTGYTLKLNKEV